MYSARNAFSLLGQEKNKFQEMCVCDHGEKVKLVHSIRRQLYLGMEKERAGWGSLALCVREGKTFFSENWLCFVNEEEKQHIRRSRVEPSLPLMMKTNEKFCFSVQNLSREQKSFHFFATKCVGIRHCKTADRLTWDRDTPSVCKPKWRVSAWKKTVKSFEKHLPKELGNSTKWQKTAALGDNPICTLAVL